MKTSRLALAILLSCAATGRAAERWAFEYFGGTPWHFVTPLTISQSGQPDIEVRARYAAKAFETPHYYAWRVGAWSGDRAWEVELIHDKIYLKNRPAGVEEFSVSHGYNLLTANRAWRRAGLIYRLGAGVVVAHPESTIRGRKLPENRALFNDGYYLSGPTVQVTAGRRFAVGKRLFVAIEAKATASYARVRVEGGHAHVPCAALHALAGLGWER